MSTESAVRHAPIAAAIPALRHPLRVDPRPRLCPSWYDKHQPCQWPLGLSIEPTIRDQLPWAVDSYIDGRKRAP